MDINKIFVINLNDRKDKWSSFEIIHDKVERFEAVDSRTNQFINKDFNLKLFPVGLNQEIYFSQFSGAIGCYLSHYLLWQKIVKKKIQTSLILEDDANACDVDYFLKSNPSYSKHYDLIQLNKRSPKNPQFFNGTESYILTLKGAKKLINLTNNHSCFQGLFRSLPPSRAGYNYSKYSCYIQEGSQNWCEPNSICAAVDRFIGFCSFESISFRNRLIINFDRRIGLSKLNSDLKTENVKPYWLMTENETSAFIDSKDFKWWENQKSIDKFFVINLEDRLHRYEEFKKIGDIERFSAIDSRPNFHVYKDYGFNLNLMGLASDLYFSQAPGAVGIYLSHYSIWKKMIEEDIELCMIMEDDAETQDVSDYLSKNNQFNIDNYDFFQLGKRCSNELREYCGNFDGLESYVLTKKGAEILVNATHDNSYFNNIIHIKPKGWFQGENPKKFDIFKDEPHQLWDKKNSITCAVDKLVGYCAHPKINASKRLRIKIMPRINLHSQEVSSDVMNLKDAPWWNKSEEELNSFLNSKQFKYWENES